MRKAKILLFAFALIMILSISVSADLYCVTTATGNYHSWTHKTGMNNNSSLPVEFGYGETITDTKTWEIGCSAGYKGIVEGHINYNSSHQVSISTTIDVTIPAYTGWHLYAVTYWYYQDGEIWDDPWYAGPSLVGYFTSDKPLSSWWETDSFAL